MFRLARLKDMVEAHSNKKPNAFYIGLSVPRETRIYAFNKEQPCMAVLTAFVFSKQ